jgi:DNA end-binding protein Ku
VMARAIWSGAISFGLVNIPVKLYGAVRDRNVHFHMLHESDGARVRQLLVCSADGEEVTLDDVVKGYEVSPEQYVVVQAGELDALAPRATRLIEVLDFVDISQIDPVYYQHPYFLVPDEQGARAYGLLLKAMSQAGKVGIGKFVMRNKQYLAALRPLGPAICLETMHFADEVVPAQSLEELPGEVEATDRELEMARQLIDMLASPFEPGRYHDDYRESVMELIETRAEGQEYTMPAPAEEPGKVIDLMSALEASLARAKEKGGKTAGGKDRQDDAAPKPAQAKKKRRAV